MNFDIMWLIIAIVLFIVEASTYGLVCIWFALGAIAAMIASLLGVHIIWQLVIFTIVSAILLVFTRKFFKNLLVKKATPTNADRIIGANGIVTESIDNVLAKGQVSVAGQIWSARSKDGEIIDKGDSVKILEIQGVKVIVEKIK